MLAPIPYVDVAGFKRRTSFSPADVDFFVSNNPGYIERKAAARRSEIHSQLSKRYLVPLGQNPPTLVPQGALLPLVSLVDRPLLGCLEIVIQVTGAGGLGVAQFQWSQDAGDTWAATGVTVASKVALTGTGMSVVFPDSSYGIGNLYIAPTPVPEIALGWLVSMVDVDIWDRRGVNAQDPTIVRYVDKVTKADAQIAQAANSDIGLFELPFNDSIASSAINHGGPLSYSEASPFVGADRQEFEGRQEDVRGIGTYGGN